MITYEYNCRNVEAYIDLVGNSDVVYNVFWIITGRSDELDPDGNLSYLATLSGNQPLTTSDITNFIPFEDLTNEIVVGWTQTAMGPVKMATFESNIAEQIELLINPVSINLYIPIPEPPDPELP